MNKVAKYAIALSIILTILFISSGCGIMPAKEYVNEINYHCADWGPQGEKIYFIKQIIFRENKKYIGNEVYLCSMNWDGTDKKEITTLWKDTYKPLSSNPDTSFIDVCRKTAQAAITVDEGDLSQLGLWTINLDGTNFKRILYHKWTSDFRPYFSSPSWFSDGSHIVFEEVWTHTPNFQYYIAKVDKEGKNKAYLTSKENDGTRNMYPAVSAKGEIAYGSDKGGGLMLMDADGKNKRSLKKMPTAYPEWNLDGTKIYVTHVGNFCAIDAKTGEVLFDKFLELDGDKVIPKKVQWNKHGFLMSGYLFFSVIKNDLSDTINLRCWAGYIKTGKKRDTSQYQYKWGYKQ